MQKWRVLGVVWISAVTCTFALNKPTVPESDQIQGKWLKADSSLKLEIYKKKNGTNAGKFFGRILWSKQKIADSILAQNILKDFVYDPDSKEWSSGTFLNPDNGKTYKSYLSINQQTLSLRTYKGLGLIGKTSFWNRVQ